MAKSREEMVKTFENEKMVVRPRKKTDEVGAQDLSETPESFQRAVNNDEDCYYGGPLDDDLF